MCLVMPSGGGTGVEDLPCDHMVQGSSQAMLLTPGERKGKKKEERYFYIKKFNFNNCNVRLPSEHFLGPYC
jgi:hypothetical protein